VSRLVARGGDDLKFAVLGERAVELRNLIALRQVRVEIIFAREDGLLVDAQAQSERGACAEFDGAAIQDRQRARQSQTHRTRVRVRLVAKTRGAAAKNLRLRIQLRVNFKANDGLPA
jgi:hypothetical protein